MCLQTRIEWFIHLCVIVMPVVNHFEFSKSTLLFAWVRWPLLFWFFTVLPSSDFCIFIDGPVTTRKAWYVHCPVESIYWKLLKGYCWNIKENGLRGLWFKGDGTLGGAQLGLSACLGNLEAQGPRSRRWLKLHTHVLFSKRKNFIGFHHLKNFFWRNIPWKACGPHISN